jgi:rSAM/selenodomain-associated transferase 2
MPHPAVAAIVPTLDEAGTIVSCLQALHEQAPEELVVVDAGSRDGTAELARRTGLCRVLDGPRNRGRQQNLGAAATRAPILVFLHADTRLEPGALEQLRTVIMQAPRVPGGCFRMHVAGADPRYRLIDVAAHLRAGLLQVPYGDQGLFAQRWAFEQVGGFPELPLLDDLYFALRLRRLGRLALLRSSIDVSDRRWRQQGVMRQSLRNWAITALAALGVPPKRLCPAYPTVRDATTPALEDLNPPRPRP